MIRLLWIFLFLGLLFNPAVTVLSDSGGRAGDEAALEALYTSTNGSNWSNSSGWSSSGMSLADNIHGVSVATIDGELRVTRIDLRDNNLSGNIEFPEWRNLTQMRLLALYFNSLDSYIPSELFEATSLEYLYLSLADENWDPFNNFPHEAARQGRGAVDPGKRKSVEENRFHGAVPSNIDNLTNLKWIVLNWTDYWTDTSDNASPAAVNGITSIPDELWNISTLEGVMFVENWNIAGSGNTFSWPSSIAHMTNLEVIGFAGGGGTAWDNVDQSYMVGPWPSDIGQLPSLRVMWMAGHSTMEGFPDFSSSPNVVMLLLKGSNFSGSLPEWVVDGSIETGKNDVAWQHFDSFSIGEPAGYSFGAGGDFNVKTEGLSGPLPQVEWDIRYVDNWDVRLNSFEGPIPASFWDNNIRKVDWSYNNLTSLGTSDLTKMTQTQNFMLKYNHIGPEPWPYLDWANQAPINYAWFEGNNYVFANMLYVPPNAPNGETVFELWKSRAKSFRYAPQRPFGQARSVTVSAGSDITLDDFKSVVTHSDNVYQWQKDGADISGATGRSLTISNAGSSDAGTYRLVVTNPGVPDLTLTSEKIVVKIN